MQKVLFAILVSAIAISMTAEAKRAKRRPASIEGTYSDCKGTMDEGATIEITNTLFDFPNVKGSDKPYTIEGEITMDTVDLDSVKLRIDTISPAEPLACPVPKQGSGYIDQTCSISRITGSVSLITGAAARPVKDMVCKNHIARTY